MTKPPPESLALAADEFGLALRGLELRLGLLRVGLGRGNPGQAFGLALDALALPLLALMLRPAHTDPPFALAPQHRSALSRPTSPLACVGGKKTLRESFSRARVKRSPLAGTSVEDVRREAEFSARTSRLTLLSEPSHDRGGGCMVCLTWSCRRTCQPPHWSFAARARIRCTGAPAKASTSNSAIAAGGSSSSDSRRVWSRSAGECGSTRGASKQPAREPLRRGSQHADRKRVRSVATIRGRRGALRRRDAATTRGALLPAGGRGAKPRDDDRPVPSRCRR